MTMTTTQTHSCFRTAAAALAAILVLAGYQNVRADESRPNAIVSPLMARDLTGIPDKEATMLIVEYLPGGASQPHRHDAHVFVYVLEGSLLMQVDGQDPVTLKPGETFYESPQDVHRQSANASATEHAKFLVFMVKDKGKPVSRPAVTE